MLLILLHEHANDGYVVTGNLELLAKHNYLLLRRHFRDLLIDGCLDEGLDDAVICLGVLDLHK